MVGRCMGTEPVFIFDSRAEAANYNQLAVAAPSTYKQTQNTQFNVLNDFI